MRRLRTMLRIAQRTTRPRAIGLILRDARKRAPQDEGIERGALQNYLKLPLVSGMIIAPIV